ncbi:hypothetical protein JOB18_043830 [Solea senegalensis]|uniref:Uncharacterized protein n=3 Tax=Solea senegalensis TaxID=28829 RepID=A0AAV6QY33_SOLSE|nr:hypothetical protein JOB18_043830 [Solea senegalensis]
MNWVGGSRSRLTMKDDAKKQRDFFEKRKMQKKLNNLGLTLPTSPGAGGPGSGSASLDLVTLFIVNQIATKKENKDISKVAVLGSSSSRKGSSKQNKPLVLPMSPCSPSQLSLVESQSQCSVQGTRMGRHVIPQGFKCRKLSPVLESGFSDNSVSDYLPPTTVLLSPFSSTSSASSGQGVFPLQLRGHTPTQPPPPWETSALEQTKFQPFSQPRGMTESMTWSCGSNPPLFPLETPTAAQVLFGSPEPHVTEARLHARHKVSLSLNQSQNMDFTLNQSVTEQQPEDDVFKVFSCDDSGKDAFQFRKIYLKDGTPVKSSAPQTVPESQFMEMEHCSCSDANFLCPGHNTDPENGCGYSPSYSCGGRSFISDSQDVEKYCPLRLQASDSQSGPHTPLTRYTDEKVTENPTCPDKPSGSDILQTESSTTQFGLDLCKCNKPSAQTRDAGTQTAGDPVAERRDASTQCSFIADCAASVPLVNFPPVVKSILPPATGRQMNTTAETSAHTASAASRGKQTPGSKMKPKAGSLPGNSITHTLSASNCDGNIFLQTSKLQFPGKKNKVGRDERELQPTGPVIKETKESSEEVRDEVTSPSLVNRAADETGTLQEIADILLLLKQRRN